VILLPPYSPELNPVENLWHYLRAHHWSNRPYQDYGELESEAAKSLCTVCLDRGKVNRGPPHWKTPEEPGKASVSARLQSLLLCATLCYCVAFTLSIRGLTCRSCSRRPRPGVQVPTRVLMAARNRSPINPHNTPISMALRHPIPILNFFPKSVYSYMLKNTKARIAAVRI